MHTMVGVARRTARVAGLALLAIPGAALGSYVACALLARHAAARPSTG
jgi:hypothetical protein